MLSFEKFKNSIHIFFKNTFFPSSLIEWDNLDSNIRNLVNISTFENTLLSFILSTENSVFNLHNQKKKKKKSNYWLDCALVLVTSLIIDLGMNFKMHLILFSSWGNDIESTCYYYIRRWTHYSNERVTLTDKMRYIIEDILNQSDELLAQGLILGDSRQYWILKFLSRIYLGK